ncbi:uncharacterized protein LOC111273449, partial [Varroa jacobsoni]|uniref:uncharacterized protein LOC111273449 n=1 Tax=Varroa jacobsoni TaxID=62625 RepID=UPI000BF2B2AF
VRVSICLCVGQSVRPSPVCPSVYPFVCPSVDRLLHLSNCVPAGLFFHPSVCLSMRRPFYPFVGYASVYLCVGRSSLCVWVGLPVRLSVCPSVYLSVSPSVDRSVRPS